MIDSLQNPADSTATQEQPATVVPAQVAPVVDINTIKPMPMPTVQPVGLSAVLDVKDKDGAVVGHYQWATHKDGTKDSLVVVKIVKAHDGTEQVLYKTYSESATAKKVMEEAAGNISVKEKIATVKIGDEYKTKDGSTSTYKVGDLLEFQGVGFVLVLGVLAGLWALISFVSFIIKSMGLDKDAPKTTAPTAPVSAPVAATMHPGMSNEKFIAILSAAAAHALGDASVSVVKFKPLNTMDWTWAVQGRVSLHNHKI
jgi:Na+-transporting methylmalonyl-CoA/oxaloacetate decarboxylase gamma subunit